MVRRHASYRSEPLQKAAVAVSFPIARETEIKGLFLPERIDVLAFVIRALASGQDAK